MSHLLSTRHARQRMQQRGISQMHIQLVHFFGEDRLQKGGMHFFRS